MQWMTQSPLVTKEQLIQKYLTTFADDMGVLEKEHYTHLNPQPGPVHPAPQQIPVAHREALRKVFG